MLSTHALPANSKAMSEAVLPTPEEILALVNDGTGEWAVNAYRLASNTPDRTNLQDKVNFSINYVYNKIDGTKTGYIVLSLALGKTVSQTVREVLPEDKVLKANVTNIGNALGVLGKELRLVFPPVA